MVKARKYVVKNRFNGVPTKNDYEVVEIELPPLKDGEVLAKAEWISVDPYLRIHNGFTPAPYDQYGFQVAVVVESKDKNYPVGTKVVSHKGWCDYSILNTKDNDKPLPNKVYKLPDLKGLSDSLAIGAVGMPGVTAYFGLLELCKPKAGETVVITGAAGAVGSLVGQIAKAKGCKVIGFAGSDDKVAWLENRVGFDKAFNYKTVDITEALKQSAPNGVDCYFDNVGGEISSTIMRSMNSLGRVTVCGSICSYNDVNPPKVTIVQPSIISKQLEVIGFRVWEWANRWPEAFEYITNQIKEGNIKAEEHIIEGFDNIFEAFLGMLFGQNYGKAVVKV